MDTEDLNPSFFAILVLIAGLVLCAWASYKITLLQVKGTTVDAVVSSSKSFKGKDQGCISLPGKYEDMEVVCDVIFVKLPSSESRVEVGVGRNYTVGEKVRITYLPRDRSTHMLHTLDYRANPTVHLGLGVFISIVSFFVFRTLVNREISNA